MTKHVLPRPQGRPILHRVGEQTFKNRLALLRNQCFACKTCDCVVHAYRMKYGTEPPPTVRQTRAPSRHDHELRRAPPATRDDLVAGALARAKSGFPWRKLKEVKQNKGVYKDGITRVQKVIEAEMPIMKTSRGAFLDPSQAIPQFLDLAGAVWVCHDREYTPSMNLFCNATTFAPYRREKCHVLSLGLPHTKQPHAQSMQLCLGWRLGNENGVDFMAQFTVIGLIAALKSAMNVLSGVSTLG